MNSSFSLADLFPNTPQILVVHIGAGSSTFTEPYMDLVAKGRARLVGFEPHPGEFAKLEARPGCTYLPHFVGDGAQATYHQTSEAMTGSLMEPNTELLQRFRSLAELTAPRGTHQIMTRALDTIPEVAGVDYIKIDVQGAELQVFKGASKTLVSCVLIQTEVEFVPLYKNQPLFADIDQHLRGRGFQFHTLLGKEGRCFKSFMKLSNDMVKQILWADAVYISDFLAFDKLATTKLEKLAILLHDIYQSFDLCMVILIELDRRAGNRALQLAYAQRLTPILPALQSHPPSP